MNEYTMTKRYWNIKYVITIIECKESVCEQREEKRGKIVHGKQKKRFGLEKKIHYC